MSGTSTPTSAEAEAGAEEARAGLADTLSQLRENLRPSNVVDEVMTSAKVNASAITDQIWETARKNPLPALLIGAGIAMILGVGQRVTSGSSSAKALGRARPANMPQSGNRLASQVSGAADQAASAATTLAARATDALGSARSATKDMLASTNDKLSSVATRGVKSFSNAVGQNRSRGDFNHEFLQSYA